jgi:hypothetical protein
VDWNQFKNRVGATITPILAFLVCFIVGVHALNSVQNSSMSEHHWGIFASSRQTLERDKRIEVITKQLEFMVWERERSALHRELASLLKHNINDKPFDPYLWRSLTFVQADLLVPIEERAWTLGQAWKLLNWNHSERFVLAHHCFKSFDEFRVVSPTLCSEIIRNLPWTSNRAVLASFVGVEEQRLEQVLAMEGISYEELNQ